MPIFGAKKATRWRIWPIFGYTPCSTILYIILKTQFKRVWTEKSRGAEKWLILAKTGSFWAKTGSFWAKNGAILFI
jgi:hypothetical protein